MADINDIAKLTAMLSAAYPNWNLTEFTNDIYFQDLQDIPSDLLMIGAQHCRTSTSRDQRFAPSAGEIRAAVIDIRRQRQGIPTALEAWGELLHAPKTEETYRVTDEYNEQGHVIVDVHPYQWSHPLVRKVAVLMGFPRFPDWESESFERAAFLKAYESELHNYLNREAQPEQVRDYISSTSQKELSTGREIKQLAKGMSK